jgi:hypothetical protein
MRFLIWLDSAISAALRFDFDEWFEKTFITPKRKPGQQRMADLRKLLYKNPELIVVSPALGREFSCCVGRVHDNGIIELLALMENQTPTTSIPSCANCEHFKYDTQDYDQLGMIFCHGQMKKSMFVVPQDGSGGCLHGFKARQTP